MCVTTAFTFYRMLESVVNWVITTQLHPELKWSQETSTEKRKTVIQATHLFPALIRIFSWSRKCTDAHITWTITHTYVYPHSCIDSLSERELQLEMFNIYTLNKYAYLLCARNCANPRNELLIKQDWFYHHRVDIFHDLISKRELQRQIIRFPCVTSSLSKIHKGQRQDDRGQPLHNWGFWQRWQLRWNFRSENKWKEGERRIPYKRAGKPEAPVIGISLSGYKTNLK